MISNIHKLWAWRRDTNNDRLLHYKPSGVDVYKQAQHRRRRNRWKLTEENQAIERCGDICTTIITGDTVKIISSSPATAPQDPPHCLLDVLREWDCLWMWKSLRLIGEDNWLEESINAGACVAVTDGSYIRELYPHLCSAAFILECLEGKGLIVGSFAETSSAASAY